MGSGGGASVDTGVGLGEEVVGILVGAVVEVGGTASVARGVVSGEPVSTLAKLTGGVTTSGVPQAIATASTPVARPRIPTLGVTT